MNPGDTILKLEGISKKFSGVSVLRNIDLDICRGEVHAILGANGAGKSTLMKIIGGVHKPDGGQIFLNGSRVTLESPSDAQNKGICVIYQELSMIPTLDAVSNVFLGREKLNPAGLIDEKKLRSGYEDICRRLNFSIPTNVKVSRLSIAQQQMIEIMKAISYDSEIIIMDEPTTSLTEKEKDKLFETVFTLKQSGKTILYISHMLDEIFKISDRITILKDGRKEGTFLKEEMDKNKVISIMTGKKESGVIQTHQKKNNCCSGKSVLEVKNLNAKGKLKNISFRLNSGEILGIAGLVGSGRTELTQAIFGVDLPETGEIAIDGRNVSIHSPGDAIKNGIGLIPEDRKNQGLIQIHEVYKNSTIIQLKRMLKGILISEKKESGFANDAVERLGIKLGSIGTKVRNLSGGNQQKVVVSKWLDMDLKVLIFDEPTKGIDVAAKEDIFRIMADFAGKGLGIIFISSDLEEVARIADRVIAMRNGCIVKELTGDDVNINNITYSVLNG